MFEINRDPIPTLFGYTTLGEFSRAMELTLDVLHCIHAVLSPLLLLGIAMWIVWHRRSSSGFSVDAQVLLLTAFLLRCAKDLWSDVRNWDRMFDSNWILFDTAARLLRVVASAIMLFITVRYSPHRVSLVPILQHIAPYVVGCIALPYALRQIGLIMPVYRAPSMKYLSSLFLEIMHLVPQSKLLSISIDHATTDAAIILSLSFLATTMVGIAEQYVAYTMYGLVDFWERAVWTHGAKVACLVIGLGCFVSALDQKRTIAAALSDTATAECDEKGG